MALKCVIRLKIYFSHFNWRPMRPKANTSLFDKHIVLSVKQEAITVLKRIKCSYVQQGLQPEPVRFQFNNKREKTKWRLPLHWKAESFSVCGMWNSKSIKCDCLCTKVKSLLPITWNINLMTPSLQAMKTAIKSDMRRGHWPSLAYWHYRLWWDS